jgi:hypothetical protein
MNADRRKTLAAIMDRIENLNALALALNDDREAIIADLETARDEEQEAFDNLPEGLQAAERGQDMEAAISELENALSELGQLDYSFDSYDDVQSYIDNARGQS